MTQSDNREHGQKNPLLEKGQRLNVPGFAEERRANSVAGVFTLERFQKYCSHWPEKNQAAVLLDFGVVFNQSQAAAGMLLHSASPKHQKSSPPTATLFFETLWGVEFQRGEKYPAEG